MFLGSRWSTRKTGWKVRGKQAKPMRARGLGSRCEWWGQVLGRSHGRGSRAKGRGSWEVGYKVERGLIVQASGGNAPSHPWGGRTLRNELRKLSKAGTEKRQEH